MGITLLSEGAVDMTATITTALQKVVTDTLNMFAAVAPPALAILGVYISVKMALRFFKQVVKG